MGVDVCKDQIRLESQKIDRREREGVKVNVRSIDYLRKQIMRSLNQLR